MNTQAEPRKRHALNRLVPVILREITQLRINGFLERTEFEKKLTRLVREELSPQGLTLQISHPEPGVTRYGVVCKKGTVYEMIDCNGTCHEAEELPRKVG